MILLVSRSYTYWSGGGESYKFVFNLKTAPNFSAYIFQANKKKNMEIMNFGKIVSDLIIIAHLKQIHGHLDEFLIETANWCT